LPSSQPTGRSIVDVPRFKSEQPRAMFGCISSNTFDDLSPVSTRCFDQEGYVRSVTHSVSSCHEPYMGCQFLKSLFDKVTQYFEDS
jgi:hypothetical protein